MRDIIFEKKNAANTSLDIAVLEWVDLSKDSSLLQYLVLCLHISKYLQNIVIRCIKHVFQFSILHANFAKFLVVRWISV